MNPHLMAATGPTGPARVAPLRRAETWARRGAFLAVHGAASALVFLAAFEVRFEGTVPPGGWQSALTALPWAVGARLFALLALGCWRYRWLDGSFANSASLALAVTASSAFLGLVGPLGLGIPALPRSILLIDWAGATLLFCGARAGIRLLREGPLRRTGAGPGCSALVLGAGDAAEALVREVRRRPEIGTTVVGLIDPDPSNRGLIHAGVGVLGTPDDLAAIASRTGAGTLLIPTPETPAREARALIEACRAIGLRGQLVPGFEPIIRGTMAFHPREVEVRDLLRREPIALDNAEVGRFLRGRVALVTGASGSIGREICREILGFGPARLVLLDHSENGVFYLQRELADAAGSAEMVPAIADITDAARIRTLLARHRPDVVFHAAAHKHVPMMELNPGEGIKNNVFGTRTVVDESIRAGVEAFVMVSTDKAVNPTSVMGACKRLAEMYVQALSDRATTRLVTVRFGNVLGSTGSVVPIFREQIRGGGPLTVTHPDMDRYFMTIPEAAQLVLQAGAFGEFGRIYVLDMGQPVSILGLARDMIRLSGLVEGRDIEVIFTGLRPGEKLSEELYDCRETRCATPHPKIFALEHRPIRIEDLGPGLGDLLRAADGPDHTVREILGDLVPEYRPDGDSRAPAPALQEARLAGAI